MPVFECVGGRSSFVVLERALPVYLEPVLRKVRFWEDVADDEPEYLEFEFRTVRVEVIRSGSVFELPVYYGRHVSLPDCCAEMCARVSGAVCGATISVGVVR